MDCRMVQKILILLYTFTQDKSVKLSTSCKCTFKRNTMKRLTLEPRTPEWHAIRAESWTASAAATLVCSQNAIALRDYAATKGVTLDIAPLLKVGMETFFENTLWSVWAEKMGHIPRFGGNEHTTRGTNNEEKVVRVLEAEEMLIAEREVTALSSLNGGLLASFDALAPASSDTTVIAPYGFPVEAKCPAFQSRKKLWDSKKAGQLAVMGLPYYWCQVQHQIYVAEAPYGWFVAAGIEVDDKTGVEKIVFPLTEKVPRDEDFLRAYIAAASFYHEHFIENFEEPPKLPQDILYLKRLSEKATLDRALVDDDMEVATDLYFQAVKDEKELKARREALGKKLEGAAAKLRTAGEPIIVLADRLQVKFSTPETTSWQKVAKELAKRLGHSEVPKEVLEACTSKGSEKVSLSEVV